MAQQIFINLPVKDLKKSIDFFTRMGYSFNEQFTNEDATCMVVSDSIYVMLLVEKFFKTFTKKEIADATKTTEVILSLNAESREAVDEIMNKAISAGATVSGEPQDHGWMYQRGYQDPNGHLWEVFYMDTAAIPQV